MKYFSFLTVLFLFFTGSLFSQINKYALSVPGDVSEEVLSIKMKIMYTTVDDANFSAYFKNGYGISASIQGKLGSVFSLFGELNYNQLKFVKMQRETINPQTIYDGMKPSWIIAAGVRIYPVRNKYPFYFKTGLGIISREENNSFPPAFNIGLGYEFKLSKNANIFLEGENYYYPGWVFQESSNDLSLGLGLSYIFTK
jgi:hypothetical protein